MHEILTELHQDHICFARVLTILEQEVNALSGDDDPDLFLIADILHYIQHYPDLIHHPKEDRVYEVFRQQAANGLAVVVELQKEHYYLPELTKELHAMVISAANSTLFVSRDELRTRLENFIKLQRAHIDLEESLLFPLIDKTLTAEDWVGIESKTKKAQDPLFGDNIKNCYENLYESIKRQEIVS